MQGVYFDSVVVVRFRNALVPFRSLTMAPRQNKCCPVPVGLLLGGGGRATVSLPGVGVAHV